jgi:hypothetical protein
MNRGPVIMFGIESKNRKVLEGLVLRVLSCRRTEQCLIAVLKKGRKKKEKKKEKLGPLGEFGRDPTLTPRGH